MANTFIPAVRPAHARLIKIVRTVARQKYRRFAHRCFVTLGDLEQDLFVNAFSNVAFLENLEATGDGDEATQAAYRYVENVARRLCRQYKAKWPRLAQRIVEEGPAWA
jgi:hypothetical protein